MNLARKIEAPDHGIKERWTKIAQRLRAELGEDLFTSWFARMEADELQANVLMVSVPTRFLRSWIENHYLAKLHKIAEVEFGPLKAVQLRVRVQGEAFRASQPASTHQERAEQPNADRANTANPVQAQVQALFNAEPARHLIALS
jgi:chromosomal replication initiation ATPase DnaA